MLFNSSLSVRFLPEKRGESSGEQQSDNCEQHILRDYNHVCIYGYYSTQYLEISNIF